MSFPRTKRSPRQWGAPDNTPLSLPPGVLLCTRQQNVSPLTGRTLKALRPHTAEYPPATLEDENLGQSQSQSPCSEAMDSFSNPTLASSTFLFCCECILCVIRINCQRPPCRVLLSFFFFFVFFAVLLCVSDRSRPSGIAHDRGLAYILNGSSNQISRHKDLLVLPEPLRSANRLAFHAWVPLRLKDEDVARDGEVQSTKQKKKMVSAWT